MIHESIHSSEAEVYHSWKCRNHPILAQLAHITHKQLCGVLKCYAMHAFRKDGKDADESTRISTTGEDVVDILSGPSLISAQGRGVDRIEECTSAGPRVMQEIAKSNKW